MSLEDCAFDIFWITSNEYPLVPAGVNALLHQVTAFPSI